MFWPISSPAPRWPSVWASIGQPWFAFQSSIGEAYYDQNNHLHDFDFLSTGEIVFVAFGSDYGAVGGKTTRDGKLLREVANIFRNPEINFDGAQSVVVGDSGSWMPWNTSASVRAVAITAPSSASNQS